MKSLLKKLDLADDASEESAVSALRAITNRATTAEGQVTTLTTERDALLKDQVEADLEKYKNRFKPEKRDAMKARLIANRKDTIAILEDTEPVAPAANGGKGAPITNRGTATPPAGGGGEDAAAQAEEVKAAKITNRARSIRAANPKVSLADSYATAEAEITAEEKK